MALKIALVGNPNSGKTSLFNRLTGSNQYVGNWPGVTVEKKTGFTADKSCEIVDLPGVYSLSPYTMEEIITRDFILDQHPDAIINIIDGSNIERNLYLTLQTLELSIPTVIAVNMMDQVRARGGDVDCIRLSKLLGVPVVPISAKTGSHIDELLSVAAALAAGRQPAAPIVCYDSAAQNMLNEVASLLANACGEGERLFFYAGKLVEQDSAAIARLKLSQSCIRQIDRAVERYTARTPHGDRAVVMADIRYRFIESLVHAAVRKPPREGRPTVTDRIDRVLTNRLLALPIFFGVIFLMFGLTFGPVGNFLKRCVEFLFVDVLTPAVEKLLLVANAPDWTYGLLADAVLGGVGTILTFVPQILLLFLCLSFLEDSGYMARAAFIMDKMMRRFGLSGKSFIPMLMGFGCTTPAVMAARSLENQKDRSLTIMLTPFMSCGARMPIYALFAGVFFPEDQGVVVCSLYLLGMAAAMLSGVVLSKTLFRGVFSPFVLELPQYHLPSLRSILLRTWEKGRGFLVKAGTIIFAMSVVVWFLQNFDLSLRMVADGGDSILGRFGRLVAPALSPLGFGTWQAAVSLLAGLVAKESVVSTMNVLYGMAGGTVSGVLSQVFTPLSAYAFMAFTLLYMPCISAFATIRREMNSLKWAAGAALYQTGVAYFTALLVYQIGSLLMRFFA